MNIIIIIIYSTVQKPIDMSIDYWFIFVNELKWNKPFIG